MAARRATFVPNIHIRARTGASQLVGGISRRLFLRRSLLDQRKLVQSAFARHLWVNLKSLEFEELYGEHMLEMSSVQTVDARAMFFICHSGGPGVHCCARNG